MTGLHSGVQDTLPCKLVGARLTRSGGNHVAMYPLSSGRVDVCVRALAIVPVFGVWSLIDAAYLESSKYVYNTSSVDAYV